MTGEEDLDLGLELGTARRGEGTFSDIDVEMDGMPGSVGEMGDDFVIEGTVGVEA